jgi:Flp pilus assembly protein TadG
MLLRCYPSRRRNGAVIVESALVYPLTFLLLLGIMSVGMGVFRYNAVAYLAREAARYASTHGGQYKSENATAITNGTLPDATSGYIINQILKPEAFGLDRSLLQVTITYNSPATPVGEGSHAWDPDNFAQYPFSQDNGASPQHSWTNTVTVTVNYSWNPEWFLTGPITLSSMSIMPMSY